MAGFLICKICGKVSYIEKKPVVKCDYCGTTFDLMGYESIKPPKGANE